MAGIPQNLASPLRMDDSMNHHRRSLLGAGLGMSVLPSTVLGARPAASPRIPSSSNLAFNVVFDMNDLAPDVSHRLTLGPDGMLYGASSYGGRKSAGAIFRVAPDGTAFELMHDFADSGSRQPEGLTLGRDGSFYGVTASRMVFRMTVDGGFTVLQDPLPFAPSGPLLESSDGRWYGSFSQSLRPGGIYRMPPDAGSAEVFRQFSEQEGKYPSGLIEAHNGLIYGTASWGGPNDKGTIFSLDPAGQVTVLHAFAGADGRHPGGLVLGPSGLLYGTTAWTKPKNRHPHGTLYSINRKTTELQTLFDFPKAREDGNYPVRLLRGRDGRYYGATYGGGRGSEGTFYRMTPGGEVQTLFRFNGTSDGGWPYCEHVEVADGEFYGVSLVGGANGRGTLYRIRVTG